jgi:hypothetical protein
VLTRIEISVSTLSVITHETQYYPGKDLMDVCWDAQSQMATVIDVEADELLFFPMQWPPIQATDPVLPTAWALVADATQCNALEGDYPSIHIDGGTFHVVRDRISNPFRFTYVGGTWAIAPPEDSRPNHWEADVLNGHAGPIRVKTWAKSINGSEPFQVTDTLNSVVVASGSVTALNTWVSVASPSHFYDYPGYPHVVTGPLSADSRVVHPLARYGDHESDPTVVPGHCQAIADTFFVGSSTATFLAPVTLPGIPLNAPLAQPESTTAYLLIGLGYRYSGAPSDPISGTGTGARLQFTEAFEIQHMQRFRGGNIAAHIPIPNESFLADTVVLAQWAFVNKETPAKLVYSDIAGVRVRPSPATASTAAVAGGGTSPASLAPHTYLSKFRSALRKDARCVMPNGSTPCEQQLLQHRLSGN